MIKKSKIKTERKGKTPLNAILAQITQLHQISKEYQSCFVDKPVRSLPTNKQQIASFFNSPDLFKGLIQKISLHLSNEEKLQACIKKFQEQWVKYQPQSFGEWQKWQSFISLCIGGYGLQHGNPTKLSEQQVQRKFKSYYSLLSTHKDLKKVEGLMSLISNKLNIHQNKLKKKTIQEIVSEGLAIPPCQQQTPQIQIKVSRSKRRDPKRHIRQYKPWSKRLVTQPRLDQAKHRSLNRAIYSCQNTRRISKNFSVEKVVLHTKGDYQSFFETIFNNKPAASCVVSKGSLIQSEKQSLHDCDQGTDLSKREFNPDNIIKKAGFSSYQQLFGTKRKKVAKRKKGITKVDQQLFHIYNTKRNVKWDLNFVRLKAQHRQKNKLSSPQLTANYSLRNQ